MRRIGHLDEPAKAKLFADHLFALGIENEIAEENDALTVWVHDEDRLEEATAELESFKANPGDKRFVHTARQGQEDWKKAVKQARADRSKPVDLRTATTRANGESPPIVTMALIAFSAFVFYLQVYVTPNSELTEQTLGIASTAEGFLPDVMRGEFWRLLTPMFLHFSFIHIFFNMMWTWNLGKVLERVHGTVLFIAMVVVLSIGSNLLQYMIDGPDFGGMSGVVFGLLGFMWMKTMWDPTVPYELPKATVWMMGIWFVICFTGMMGPVANWGHAGGLIAGVAWGAFSSPRFRKQLGIV